MDRATTCCFTGHRPNKLPWGEDERAPRCLALKARLAELLEDCYRQGYRHFICGMAQGADMYFGEAVLALREKHPDVTLEAAIPSRSRPPAGRNGTATAISGWWSAVIWRPWCSTAIPAAVCSGATVIWWIAPRWSWPSTTGCWGGPCIP